MALLSVIESCPMHEDNPVTEAISSAGGVTKFAARFPYQISHQAIRKWERYRVPAERVLEFERVSGIPRHRIRPDLYPAEEVA